MTHTENTAGLRLSFEYFPPKTDTANERLWRAISRHSVFNPRFISVTYGAGGTTRDRTLKTLKRVKASSRLQAAGHLTTVGGSKNDVLDVAKSYREAGVEHIVALRGDAPKNTNENADQIDQFSSSVELISALKDLDFDISVGAYPEQHPEAQSAQQDIEYLKQKFDAGANRAITQFFFEKDSFLRFRDQATKIGIDKPIIPGLLPIENFENVERFSQSCGANVPAWLKAAFDHADTKEAKHLLAVSIACDMIENLRAEGVDHVHIYTLNNPELTYDIGVALGLNQVDAVVNRVA